MPLGRWVMRIAEFGLVDVLAAGALCAHGVDLEIAFVDVDVDILNLGQHRDGGGRSVDAAGSLGVGHALHAVHARFEFELGEDAAAVDLGDDLLEPAFAAFADRQDFRLPALFGGVAFVHAEQVAGEQRGFVAAGAGADFQDGVVVVHRVFGNERELELAFERFLTCEQRRPLGVGELAHLGIGRVRRERLEVGDLGGDGAIGLDRLDDGRELGEFARQLDVVVAAQISRELAFHQVVAGEQGVELVLRQRNQSCSPSAAAKPSSLWRIDTLPTGCSRNGRIAVSPLRQSRSSSNALTGPTAEGDSDSDR